MGPVDAHLERLKQRLPAAGWTDTQGQGLLVTLPQFPLPPGWNRAATDVYFLAPSGYPLARPDSFWTDGDLRLASRPEALPQNTQFNPAGVPQMASKLWFSWHLEAWDPNRDDLISWVASIRTRLGRLS